MDEFRVGHNVGWSTAQGRFGAPLKVIGVQQPSPPLKCSVVHITIGIMVSVPYANPVKDDRSVRPFPPATEIYVMIYAQVYQSDGTDFRNVLLGHKRAYYKQRPLERNSTPDEFYCFLVGARNSVNAVWPNLGR